MSGPRARPAGRELAAGKELVLRRTKRQRRAAAGRGAEIFDPEGRYWLDVPSNVFVALLGATPPFATRITASMQQRQFGHADQVGGAEDDALASALMRRAPRGFGVLLLTASGATAGARPGE